MSFTRAKPAGWIFNGKILFTEANHIDINQSRAVDGFDGGSYAPTAALTWNHQLTVSATTVVPANANAIMAVGKGTGYGISTIGGATSGPGIHSIGGAPNGMGGEFNGTGTAPGITSTGGAVSGNGVVGLGGAPNGTGGAFQGAGVGSGVDVIGGANSGTGVASIGGAPNGLGGGFQGVGTGIGIDATGGVTNADGVRGTAGGNGVGVHGVAGGVGFTAMGVYGYAHDGYGVCAEGDSTTPACAAFRIVPQDTQPTNGQVGDLYINSGDKKLYICTAAPATWVVVGSQ
jgi:hypothetical protein